MNVMNGHVLHVTAIALAIVAVFGLVILVILAFFRFDDRRDQRFALEIHHDEDYGWVAGQPGKNTGERAGLVGREPQSGVSFSGVATPETSPAGTGSTIPPWPGTSTVAQIEAQAWADRATETACTYTERESFWDWLSDDTITRGMTAVTR